MSQLSNALWVLLLFTSLYSYSQEIDIEESYLNSINFVDVDERDCEIEEQLRTINSTFNTLFSNELVFSKESGYYSSEFYLYISLYIPTLDSIYYTIDGSIPTENSFSYEDSIKIDFPSNPAYSFKALVIRARAFSDGMPVSKIVTKTYLLDTLMENRFDFPVISIVTDPSNLYDNDTGIYVKGVNWDSSNPNWTGNYYMTGIEWERDIHIQYFENNGDLVIDQDAGVRIHGGKQRAAAQKSLRIYAREEYGEKNFNYKLLPEKRKDEYKRFILRTSKGTWSGTVIKDQLGVGLTKGLGLEIQGYRPVVLLINGDYWGIQTIRDYFGVHHFSDKYNVDKDSVNIGSYGALYDGNVMDYSYVDSILVNTDISIDSNYQKIINKIDVRNLINYYNTEVYLNNYDWPGGNLRIWNAHDDYVKNNEKLKWMLYDLDAAFGTKGAGYNMLNHITVSSNWPYNVHSARLFNNLITNTTFKNNFIVNAAYLMNYYFQQDTIVSATYLIRDEYDPEMPEHFQRWNEDYNSWAGKIDSKIISFANQRRSYINNHYMSKFSLSGTQMLSLVVNDENNGQIYINRMPVPYTNNVGEYFTDIPIELSAIPKYGYKFSHWEHIIDSFSNPVSVILISDTSINAVFEIDTTVQDVKINEILVINHTDIIDENNEHDDWVEIFNNSDSIVDLSNFYLTDNISLDPFKWKIQDLYPDSVKIQPDSFIVFYLDNDPEQGVLHANFKLFSQGESLGLIKKVMGIPVIIDSVTFNAQIVDISYGRIPDGVDTWMKLSNPTANSSNIDRDLYTSLFINEVLASNSTGIIDDYFEREDWIEVYNSSNDSIELGGLFLTDDESRLMKYRIPTSNPDKTIIAPNSFLLFYADEEDFQGVNHTNFKLSSSGEPVILSQMNNGVIYEIDSLTYPQMLSNQSYGRFTDGNDELVVFTITTPNSTNNTTLISEFEYKRDVLVYPNPTKEIINIDFGSLMDRRISVFNILGEIVYQQNNINTLTHSIKLNEDNGLYFIEIKSDNDKHIYKIVKE